MVGSSAVCLDDIMTLINTNHPLPNEALGNQETFLKKMKIMYPNKLLMNRNIWPIAV